MIIFIVILIRINFIDMSDRFCYFEMNYLFVI